MSDAYDPRLVVRGNGPAVVLVPGINGSGELFYRQVPRLDRFYTVASYSLRDEAESLDQLDADLALVVDTVAPVERRAIVIGESFGGAVALTFALRYPERVAALVIVNSFAHFEPQMRLRLGIAGATLVPWGAMSALRHVTASRLHSPHTGRVEIKQFIQLTANASRRGYLNRLKLLRRFDVRERLHAIAAPTLFVAAECDRLVPAVEQARLMTSRVPSSTMRILEGHGHICLIAPGVDLAAIMREWLEGGTVERR